MFTIIGGDGKEYGPVTTEQVRGWINTGRASLETKARAAGSEEWRRLGDYAEFGSAAVVPPALAAAGATGSFRPVDQDLAGLGARFVGALVDGIIEALCWMPTSLAVWAVMRQQVESGAPSLPVIMAAIQAGMIKSLPYLAALVAVQCALLSFRGQSIGKLLLGIRIVRVSNGQTAGFLHAFLLRGVIPWVLSQIPILGKLFWLVDVCFIFGDQRRCVHDYIGGTKVVKT